MAPSDLELLPSAAAAGPALVAGELLARTVAELPVVGELPGREQLLVSAWLTGLRSPRTPPRLRRRCGGLAGLAAATSNRRLGRRPGARGPVGGRAARRRRRGRQRAAAAVGAVEFLRLLRRARPGDPDPTAGVARPMVDADYTATVGLDRDEARALLAAADADPGAQALRTAAAVRLLLHNALRVDEACAADVADLGTDSGHRVLRVTREGARWAKIPLAPATGAALDAYLAARAARAGLDGPARLTGPLLATATGGRLRQAHLGTQPANPRYLHLPPPDFGSPHAICPVVR